MLQRAVRQLILLITATALLSWPLAIAGYPVVFMDTVPFFTGGRKALSIVGIMPQDTSQSAARGSATADRATSLVDPPSTQSTTQAPKKRSNVIRSPFYGAPAIAIATVSKSWSNIAVAQALWLAAALLLALRRLGLASARSRLAAIAAISLLTSLAFYTHVLIADVFGGLVPLALALLIVKGRDMSAPERGFWWASLLLTGLFHASFLVHGTALLLVLVPWLWRKDRATQRSALTTALLLGVAALGHLAVPVLADRSNSGAAAPPFLLARIIADGTAAKVLRDDCPQNYRPSCDFLPLLPMTENQFLWEGKTIKPWVARDDASRVKLNADQNPLLGAVLTRYPGAQLVASLKNSANQFVTVDLDDFAKQPTLGISMRTSGFAEEYARFAVTPMGSGDTLYLGFAALWRVVYLVSMLIIPAALAAGIFAPNAVTTRIPAQLRSIAAIIFVSIALNAAVNGALAGVFGRYQGRISWLALFVVLVMAHAVMRPAETRTASRRGSAA